jgi:hypothetical protein
VTNALFLALHATDDLTLPVRSSRPDGLTAQALKDFLPVDATLNTTTVQNHTLTVAQRCEDELGEEQWAFVEGCPADWAALPIPDGPLTVGIDGGYVRHWEEKRQHFEVIVGKSILAFRRDDEEDIPSSKCLGLASPKNRRNFVR